MKKQAKEITVGKATKYKRVKFDVAKIIVAYKSGKPVSQIALTIGFPPNCRQNRTRHYHFSPLPRFTPAISSATLMPSETTVSLAALNNAA
jgi:hypothetical protein